MVAAPHIEARIEDPPNLLKIKAPRTVRGADDAALRDADDALKNMRDEFRVQLAFDMTRVRQLMAAFKQAPDPETVDEMFRLIHDLRGQAATFGYPLITEVGCSFCLYVLQTKRVEDLNIDLLEQHVNALSVIRREQIEGHGDSLSRNVLTALTRAVETEAAKAL
ncbi:MAG: Hpt domain-containing protein [Alphaproteobacteria bacterium]|nr:Hpt domain-containing protein [Alphaproteobacteria bacterium]